MKDKESYLADYAIIGGAGFVGTNLAQMLLEGGHAVHCMDRAEKRSSPNLRALSAFPRFAFTDGDVRNRDEVAAFLASPFDAVFHLASVVGVRHYVDDPVAVIDTTVMGTRHVADICRTRDLRLIFASTSEVLGRNPATPWRENADRVYGPCHVARWAYGSSKGVAEHLVNAMAGQGLRVTTVRFFNLYGPWQAPDFIVSKSLYHALRGERPLLYDSGEQTRCFTYIDDVVEALVRIAVSSEAVGETYHLGSRFEHSIAEVVGHIQALAGQSAGPIGIDTERQYGRDYEDIGRRVPEISKAERDLGWRAQTPLRDGLARFRDWALNAPWWLGAAETV